MYKIPILSIIIKSMSSYLIRMRNENNLLVFHKIRFNFVNFFLALKQAKQADINF